MAKATKLVVQAPIQIIYRGAMCSTDCMLYDCGDWPLRCQACLDAEKAAAK